MIFPAALQLIPVLGAIALLLLTGFVLFRALVTRQRHLVWLMILQILMSLYLIAFHVTHFGSDLFIVWAMRLRSPIVLSLLPTFYFMIRSLVKDSIPAKPCLVAHYALPLLVFIGAVIPLVVDANNGVSKVLMVYSGLIITFQMLAYFVLYLVRFNVFMEHVHTYVGGDVRRSIWLSRIFLFFSLLIIALDTGLISFFFKINEAPGLYALLLLVSVFLLIWQVMRTNYGSSMKHSIGSVSVEAGSVDADNNSISAGSLNASDNTDTVTDGIVREEGDSEEASRVREILSYESRVELHRRIIAHLSEQRVLSDTSLSLKKLALDLQTNTKYVSLVINDFEGASFPNFINRMRVNLVMQLMADEGNKSYTLFALGQMAGFKSKSTFIEAFKQQTGVTPSEYQRIK